ncbi:MAG TPA: hypothetical protein VJ963_05085, partial [Bacteroidales bacterium]|nr:hypothetical protein [Bacteroidales bacterium]
EKVVSALMVIVIAGLGLFPRPVFNTAKPALGKILNSQRVMLIDYPVTSNYKATAPSYIWDAEAMKNH